MDLSKRGYSNDTRILPFKNFNAEFERQLPQQENYRSAFDAAEEKVGRFYSSFESFKSSRSQRKRMNAPPGPPSKDSTKTPEETRGPEIGPALKRDRLLQRVRAARKRLSPAPSTMPRLP